MNTGNEMETVCAKHIVLVGIASAGKTTMGRESAKRLGLPFADNDEEALKAAAVKSIDDALSKLGEDGWNSILFREYRALLGLKERHVIAASPRLLDRKGFWLETRKKALSIHLRSTPLAVLTRDLKNQGFKDAITAGMRKEYERYYWWRLGHCRKADLELRLIGQLDEDVSALDGLIRTRI